MYVRHSVLVCDRMYISSTKVRLDRTNIRYFYKWKQLDLSKRGENAWKWGQTVNALLQEPF